MASVSLTRPTAPATITLTLTEEEAKALCAALRNIGGRPVREDKETPSVRSILTDSIGDPLAAALGEAYTFTRAHDISAGGANQHFRGMYIPGETEVEPANTRFNF